jgi:hypothetical protein
MILQLPLLVLLVFASASEAAVTNSQLLQPQQQRPRQKWCQKIDFQAEDCKCKQHDSVVVCCGINSADELHSNCIRGRL